MAAFILWIDHSHAKAYKLLAGKFEMHGETRHQTKNHDHIDGKTLTSEDEKFFHAVANDLKDASEVLVVGPGLAKTHFKTHLEKHHHANLAKKIVGVEAVDNHVSEGQLLALGRKFFRAHDQFTGA